MSTVNSKNLVLDIAAKSSKFTSSIVIDSGKTYIDAKSVMGLFTSFVNIIPVTVYINGADCEAAEAELRQLFDKYGLNVEIKSSK